MEFLNLWRLGEAPTKPDGFPPSLNPLMRIPFLATQFIEAMATIGIEEIDISLYGLKPFPADILTMGDLFPIIYDWPHRKCKIITDRIILETSIHSITQYTQTINGETYKVL